MLFHIFGSQEERRKFGGSDFIELQYCRLKHGLNVREIISINAISDWKNDSLYISGDDSNVFFSHYNKIFHDGIYANEKSGVVDLCGINYYSPEQSVLIVEQVREKRPLDYQILLSWLRDIKNYNGFYILGL